MKEMKKTNLLPLLVLCSGLVFTTSCSKDEAVECHECHIAYPATSGEIEVPITNSAGGEDFCVAELETAEAPGYTHTIPETIVGADTIPAGTYSEIHCEEHGDH